MTSQPAQDSPQWSADELIPFGKYLLLERISSGGTAAVYRAKIHGEAGFERIVAVKRILPHMAGDPEFVDTFVREAKTTARLTHTNICPIYELGRVGESLYMSMECIAGKDLGRITTKLRERGWSLPPIVAAWIAARLCDALDYAHALKDARGNPVGIVHRDLSPANVVISYEGQVKLIDFGLAKAVGRAQQTNVDALKKKLGYMSPEMVKGRPLDARSDIFGVGVLLYEMVTERRLFAGKDDMATLKLVSRASVPPPSAITEDTPEELELVIMRALEREPEDRWQTAGDMAQALTTYVTSEDPLYGPRKLSAFLSELFADELAAERDRTRLLLQASNDPAVLASRRTYFSSASGAVAAARAQLERRITAERPVTPSTRAHASSPSDNPPRPHPGEFEDEQTTIHLDGDEPFDEEATQAFEPSFAADERLKVVAIEDSPFDEEATEIFFNKEDGLGLSELLAEVHSDAAPRGRIAAPIISQSVAPPSGPARSRSPQTTTAHAVFPAPGRPVQDTLPPASSLPTAPKSWPPGNSLPPGSTAPVRASLPPAPAPTASVRPGGLPPSAPVPPSTALAVSPPSTAEMIRSRTRAATVLDDRARRLHRQERLSNWMLVAGIVLLGLAVAGLFLRTPLGERLGVRASSRGTIEVRTNPPIGAAIKLDGVLRGRAPLRLTGVLRGERRVELEAAGYQPEARIVRVDGGDTSIVNVTLRPISSP